MGPDRELVFSEPSCLASLAVSLVALVIAGATFYLSVKHAEIHIADATPSGPVLVPLGSGHDLKAFIHVDLLAYSRRV